nr:auxin-responsive protein SAUR50-like [Ipomoea batatas]
MAKLSRANGNKKNGLKFKILVEKVQKSFLLGKRSPANQFDEFDNSEDVPNDVKEGHFAVMAVDDDDDKLKRFIVPLSCLRNPCFLRLLEKAAEEYGFEHEGALMLPCRSNGKKYNVMNLKTVVQMFQKSFVPDKRSTTNHSEEFEDSKDVANDVKEGHFAVMAVDDEKLKRFIVPLSCLTHPSFLRLLEKAAEEYGFEHEGALMLPCRPSELEKIIARQWKSGSSKQAGLGFLSNWKKKNGMNLKTVVQMFQKSFLLSKRSSSNHFDEFEDSKDEANDVKEGHFAVMAVDDEKLKRFIVPLSCLTHPTFLRLLEKAAEEYGFEHEGALMLPCRPCELEKIIAMHWKSSY